MTIFRIGLALSLAPLLFPTSANAADPVASPYSLPEPDVIMKADPPPPFTYWAPAGSTIRNHRNDNATWIAETGELHDIHYFGDQCKASELQQYIGGDLEELPPIPDEVLARFSCTECAVQLDLQTDRLNIVYDEETNQIERISCG